MFSPMRIKDTCDTLTDVQLEMFGEVFISPPSSRAKYKPKVEAVIRNFDSLRITAESYFEILYNWIAKKKPSKLKVMHWNFFASATAFDIAREGLARRRSSGAGIRRRHRRQPREKRVLTDVRSSCDLMKHFPSAGSPLLTKSILIGRLSPYYLAMDPDWAVLSQSAGTAVVGEVLVAQRDLDHNPSVKVEVERMLSGSV